MRLVIFTSKERKELIWLIKNFNLDKEENFKYAKSLAERYRVILKKLGYRKNEMDLSTMQKQ